MWVALRHLLAIGVLPGTVTVLIPIWITYRFAVSVAFPDSWFALALAILAVVIGLVGVMLVGATVRRFAHEGLGTLAPWDPPRSLVVTGAYRFVRNPMISGVLLILAGEALALRSVPHGWWMVTFLVINLIYIPLWEEPMLNARFGSAYREYRRNVPRLLPRLRPWHPDRAR